MKNDGRGSLYLFWREALAGSLVSFIAPYELITHFPKSANDMKKTTYQLARRILPSHLPGLAAIGFVLIMLGYFASGCVAQSTPKRTLLALSKGDHILAIVDPATLKVIAKVPVGSDPHEVIASADGKTAPERAAWNNICRRQGMVLG